MVTAGPASGTPCNLYKSRCGSVPDTQSIMVAELQSFIQDWIFYSFIVIHTLQIVPGAGDVI